VREGLFTLPIVSFGADESHSWSLDGMREDFARRGLLAPSEAMVRESCLKKGVEAPDLAAMKDFTRFSAAASKGKIVELPTADSLNTFLEWFFAGFTRVTGTQTNAEDRSEVYNVSY
jgi:hypothetical protein